MRIHSPEMTSKDGLITLSARVSLESGSQEIPDRLWFTIPQRFEHLCAKGFEPFVVAVSALASANNEAVHIEGPFSERLSLGLDEYWRVLTAWSPKDFSHFRLTGAELMPETVTPGHAAAAFSGGVDSFFTQFRDNERPAGFRIKYAMFVHGLDIPLKDKDIFENAAAQYEPLLAERGVELVRVTSNVRAFVPTGKWELAHGSVLIGTALTLSSGVSRFFVPSSANYVSLRAWGSNPLIDGLLSTDRMQIIHDGATHSRFEKLQAMKDWQPLRDVVRICYEHPDAFQNCGHCKSCRKTMMLLASLGVLENFPTFPKVRSPQHFLTCRWSSPHQFYCASQAIALAKERGDKALAWTGRASLQTSRVHKLIRNARLRSRALRKQYLQSNRQPA